MYLCTKQPARRRSALACASSSGSKSVPEILNFGPNRHVCVLHRHVTKRCHARSLAQRFASILLPNNFLTISFSVSVTCWNAEFSFLDDNSFDGSQSFGGGNGHSLFADSDDEGGGAAFFTVFNYMRMSAFNIY